MDKAGLRRQYLTQRQLIARSRYWIMTDEIMDQVRQIHWSVYSTVHIFLPIRKHNEVDTFSILNYFKTDFPELTIVVPRTDFANLTMVNVRYDHELTILGRNQYDIPEPIHGSVVDPGEIDLVFIPLLSFDLNGNRVGYGKGFYDRFLKTCRPDVKKVGISFFPPEARIDDVNEHDIPMDACITPGKTWIFSTL